mmetsp:Transcript_16561/g.41749  ORF Transcript_16561/g.41749 Transcript_16561/m.41749 type:complete len:219 (-) Transcript_16561:338-994(-)
MRASVQRRVSASSGSPRRTALSVTQSSDGSTTLSEMLRVVCKEAHLAAATAAMVASRPATTSQTRLALQGGRSSFRRPRSSHHRMQCARSTVLSMSCMQAAKGDCSCETLGGGGYEMLRKQDGRGLARRLQRTLERLPRASSGATLRWFSVSVGGCARRCLPRFGSSCSARSYHRPRRAFLSLTCGLVGRQARKSCLRSLSERLPSSSGSVDTRFLNG